ncbi:unnamed protein product, partial [Symbiodinium necroappetens]
MNFTSRVALRGDPVAAGPPSESEVDGLPGKLSITVHGENAAKSVSSPKQDPGHEDKKDPEADGSSEANTQLVNPKTLIVCRRGRRAAA